MTASTKSQRIFSVRKDNLSIFVSTMHDYVTGAIFSYWAVFQDNRPVKSDIIDGTHHLPTILKAAADGTTLRTPVLDMALRTLTWTALENHEHVPASELRAGDCLSVGGGNYVCVESAVVDGDVVRVRYEGNAPGVEHRFESNRLCNLSMRGAA